MTKKELIDKLIKLNPDTIIYFDCPECGTSHKVGSITVKAAHIEI